jgi:hypothetical protein
VLFYSDFLASHDLYCKLSGLLGLFGVFIFVRGFRLIRVLWCYDFRREFRDGRVIITGVGLDRLKIQAVAVTQLCAFTSSLIV